jgi:phospho-N-acetylmuramoyl-pentapeptide-transferase
MQRSLPLVLSLTFGPLVIRKLREFKFGQEIREEGPASHQAKRGTPTMGGVMIIGSVMISTLLWANLKNWPVWIAIVGLLGCAAVGFADDYIKIAKKRSLGLTGRQKLLGQLIVGLLVGGMLFAFTDYSTVLSVPFFKRLQPNLYIWGYVAFIIFIMTGWSNAVNLTDGLDGLAISVTTVAASTLTGFTYIIGHKEFAGYLGLVHTPGVWEVTVFGARFGRRKLRFFVVQRSASRSFYGRCRQSGNRRRALHDEYFDQAGTGDADNRRRVFDRSSVSNDPGRVIQVARQTSFQNGSAASSL